MKRASWAPVITPAELARRTVLFLVLALVLFSIFLPHAKVWQQALGLSLITASLFGLILTAVEYLPEEDEGKVTGRRG